MMVQDQNPALGYLQQYVRGFEDYSQAGSDIPSLRLQDKYAQEQGGPLVDQTLISASPSFDIPPDIDSPEIDAWVEDIRRRQGPTVLPPNIKELINQRAKNWRSRLKGV